MNFYLKYFIVAVGLFAFSGFFALFGVYAERKVSAFIQDRLGHDRRYAIDASKIKNELGWEPTHTFEIGIRETIHWYLSHKEWWQRILSGEYQQYYSKQYAERLKKEVN